MNENQKPIQVIKSIYIHFQFKNKFEEPPLVQCQVPPQQLKAKEKPLNQMPNPRAQNKENCYSFLEQHNKEHIASNVVNAEQTSSNNKQRSANESKNRQAANHLNAQETYNKLLAIMNEKYSKNFEQVPKHKSFDKSNKSLGQFNPQTLTKSGSNKKL